MTAPAAEPMPFSGIPLGTPVHIPTRLSFPEWSHWGVVVAVNAHPEQPVVVRIGGGSLNLRVPPRLLTDLRPFEGAMPPRCAFVDMTGSA